MLHRKQQAFTQGTRQNHTSQIRLYISFCIHFGLRDIDPEPDTACLYVEFLAQNLKSPKSVANYISSVKFLHKWLGQPVQAFESFEVSLLLRACNLTMGHVPLQRRPLSPDLIRLVLKTARSTSSCYPVLKCAILFSFFGFLRMSNLTPRITSQFDPKKHTCKGDIFRAEPGLIILLKWSKTNQFGQNSELIPIPQSTDPQLCPVAAYNDLEQLVPTTSPNKPLFSLPAPLSDPASPVHPDWLARELATALRASGQDPSFYSFHSLRRSGATTAYRAGVQFAQIKKHGCWRSDAFWTYVTNCVTGHTQVTRALANV